MAGSQNKFEAPLLPRKTETEEQFVLTPEEKKRFEELCAQWDKYDDDYTADGFYLRNKALYEISQMGEKILPTLLFSEDEAAAKLRSNADIRELLESVTTKNTAVLVLRAMQEKKISDWRGAMAVAKGGKDYLDGLGLILDGIEPGKAGGRDDQIRLIEALSMIGGDAAVPFLKKFLEKAEKNTQYGVYPAYLFQADVNEILKALLRIGSPQAMAYIKELSASGDKFVKDSAQMALDGELSVSELKFDIIQPPKKLEAPQKTAKKEFSSKSFLWKKINIPKEYKEIKFLEEYDLGEYDYGKKFPPRFRKGILSATAAGNAKSSKVTGEKSGAGSSFSRGKAH